MRIIVLTYVHANLPALQAVLTDIRKDGYDFIVHTGDVFGIGPFPAECVELLMSTANVRFVMGNHESWYVYGLPNPLPPNTSDAEVEHVLWTHGRLGSALRDTIVEWPYRVELEESGIQCEFKHYALDSSGRGFVRIIREPAAADLDRLHASTNALIVFYGHDHSPSDVQGARRYVDPGALGCSKDALARYCSVEVSTKGLTIEHRAATYDTAELFAAFEERKVPDRDVIQRVRFGRDI